jgi:hypothetical protein
MRLHPPMETTTATATATATTSASASAIASASATASTCVIASIRASVSASNTTANEREQQRELHEVKPVELRAHGLDDAVSPREHARPRTTTTTTTTTSSSSSSAIDITIAVVVVFPECSVLGVRVGCDGSGAALVRALELYVICQQGHVYVYAHARHYPPPLAHESTHQYHIITRKHAVYQICLKNSHDTARGITKWEPLAPVLDLDLLVVHTRAAALHLS